MQRKKTNGKKHINRSTAGSHQVSIVKILAKRFKRFFWNANDLMLNVGPCNVGGLRRRRFLDQAKECLNNHGYALKQLKASVVVNESGEFFRRKILNIADRALSQQLAERESAVLPLGLVHFPEDG